MSVRRKKMEKLKSNGEYEDYKKKKQNKEDFQEKKAKDLMTASQKKTR